MSEPSDYYKRIAVVFENIRDQIGFGYGEGDIERVGEIVQKRLKSWDRLDKEEIARRAQARGK